MAEYAAISKRLTDYVHLSPIALTIADLRLPDAPLVAVNASFCRTTEYSEAESLGRNCRFLQPREGAGPVRARMKSFLHDRAQSESEFVIINEKKGGGRFVNLVYLTKIVIQEDETIVLGSQFDVSKMSGRDLESYQHALNHDISALGATCDQVGLQMLGSTRVLAASAGLIARTKLTTDV